MQEPKNQMLGTMEPPLMQLSVKLVKLYNIENFCTILGNYSLLFVTKLQRIEFFLLSSNFLVPPLYPPKNINGSQLAKMKKSIPDMSPPWNL